MDAMFDWGDVRLNIRVAAVWIVDDHVLVHKDKDDDHWALPGGRIKLLEDASEALKREMMEELNVHVEVERMIWTTENFFQYEGCRFHEIGFYYALKPEKTIFKKESFYGFEKNRRLLYHWIPINSLSESPLEPSFLREGLQDLPLNPVHIVVRDEEIS